MGIGAHDGKEWMVAPAEPDLMVARFAALITQPGAGDAMGGAARRFVLENHDWDATLAPVEDLVRPNQTLAPDAAKTRHAA